MDSLPGHIDPETTALRWRDGSRTYSELRSRALGIAASLQAQGLEPGDRVATFFFNRGETFELYFACAYAGLTLVPISFRLTAHEVRRILEDCQPRLIVTQDELAQVVMQSMETLTTPPQLMQIPDHATSEHYEAWATAAPLARPASTEIQMILYTSGTTGHPKGVTMAQQSILWFAFQQVAFYDQMGPACNTLITGPMYNTAAMNEQSIPTFLAGGTVCIMPSRGWTAAHMVNLIDTWQVTHTLIYPSMFEPLFALDKQTPVELKSLTFVLTGGENCPPALMAQFRQRWAHISLAIGYGSTESGVVTLIADDEQDRKPGSVGRVAGGQLLAIFDSHGQPVPAGTVGEVWTSGPAVTRGYWNAPTLNAETLNNGWLRIGDLGRLDEDGYLFISGRSKDLVISKGQNIYPAEIENVLVEHPSVLDCSVIGVPDDEMGEAVCACVVSSDPDLTADEIIEFVRSRIASYKKPKHVVFMSELPRSPSAKVEKRALAETVLGLVSPK